MADKLDGVLMLLVQHSAEHLTHDPATHRIFSHYLDIFENRILVTHKSKFVQFILFHCCVLHPPLAVVFADRLLSLFLRSSNHPLIRQSAALYLSSLLARATFIPLEKIK